MPSYYRQEDLEIAFASLTTETRQRIATEMMRAINDTTMEYHRNTGMVATDLYHEMLSIRQILNEVIAAQEAFDELSVASGDHGSLDVGEHDPEDRPRSSPKGAS